MLDLFLYFSDQEEEGRGIPGDGFIFPLKLIGVTSVGSWDVAEEFYIRAIFSFMRGETKTFRSKVNDVLVSVVINQLSDMQRWDLMQSPQVWSNIFDGLVKQLFGSGVKGDYFEDDESWYISYDNQGYSLEDTGRADQWDGLRSTEILPLLEWWADMSKPVREKVHIDCPVTFTSVIGSPVFVPKAIVSMYGTISLSMANNEDIMAMQKSVITVPNDYSTSNKLNRFLLMMRCGFSAKRLLVRKDDSHPGIFDEKDYADW